MNPARPEAAPAKATAPATHPAAVAHHPHLRRRLVTALAVPLLLWTAFSAVSDFDLARNLTDDAYDQSLASTAEALAARLETDHDSDLADHLDATMRLMERLDAPDRWHYLVLDATGRRRAGNLALSALAEPRGPTNPSYRSARFADEPVRVATYRYDGIDGRATIVVAESLQRRNAAVRRLVGATLWPNVVLVALALLIVLLAVRYGLRPLQALGERMARHTPDDLTPLPLDGTPAETLPLLRELNALLLRVQVAAQGQQRFLNQAAHQLRTPLATLQAQIDLWRATPERADPQRLAQMHDAVLRMGHLTRQLLALARSDAGAAAALQFEPLDLGVLLAGAAAEWDDAARARQLDLVFELPADGVPLVVRCVPWMLRELLQNLVDNALAYAPGPGELRVRCGRGPWPPGSTGTRASEAPVFIEVEDTGPGIPPELHDLAFQPFVRLAGLPGVAPETRAGPAHRGSASPQGSGLGLAIVREIAARHHAQVSLGTGPQGRGTRVRVDFLSDAKSCISAEPGLN